MPAGTINTSRIVFASQVKLTENKTFAKSFQVDYEEADFGVKITPAFVALYPEENASIRILLNGGLLKSMIFPPTGIRPITVWKTIDKGNYVLEVEYKTDIPAPNHYVLIDAAITQSEVVKPPPPPEPKPSLCPFFMGGLITILTILMAIGL